VKIFPKKSIHCSFSMFFHVFPICHLSHSSVICSLDLQEGAETQSLVFSIPNFLAKAEGWVDLYVYVCSIVIYYIFIYLLIYLFIYLLFIYLFIDIFIYLVVYMMIYGNRIYMCVCVHVPAQNIKLLYNVFSLFQNVDLYSCPVTNGSPCQS
jgi:hypothetical protein